ncbi:universal stress protein [Miltoncostaea marina]|uniref:universal stress protein n=1 Tax=Miltoncostaea marina TaxID=2843215 RepID=UPI001C3CF4CA|nr:universal stress protein [Miltoncostaea marina]
MTAFARVVCGIDGTREAVEAARQAARVTAPGGRLLLLAVAAPFDALAGRWGPEPPPRARMGAADRTLEESLDELRARARASLELAGRQATGPAEVATRVVDGDVDARILEVLDEERADLLVVGPQPHGRLLGAAVGEVTTTMLHDAPVSVLVARRPFEPDRFPATIVAGVDGSPASRRALAVAAALRERAGGRLTVVAAGRDAAPAEDALEGLAAPHGMVVSTGRPVEALVDAARTADLLVVGSRGLRGATALGSVSERVAHRAPSSVLVVRARDDAGR